MPKIRVRPQMLRQFGSNEGATFTLVTNRSLVDQIEIDSESGYARHAIVPFQKGDDFEVMLENGLVPTEAHVLVISPEAFFQSPRPEALGQRRKLLAMACNSTPTSIEALSYFIGEIERTDPEEQQMLTDRLFEAGQSTEHLTFVDEKHEAWARFNHLDDSYIWNEQTGKLAWGEQQIAPSGEISVLPVSNIFDFDENRYLDLNGQIAFCGQPVLHSGSPSFSLRDQARHYAALETMRSHAVIANVEAGTITGLHASHPAATPAVHTLMALFEVDTRYRKIQEIGFAVNCQLSLLPGNFAMNEVYGGSNGTIHWGLGLTPFTQYHLDIICPNLFVVGSKDELIFGTRPSSQRGVMQRRKVAGCMCAEGTSTQRE